MSSLKKHLITLPSEVLEKYDKNSFPFGPFDLYPYEMVVSVVWIYDINEAPNKIVDTNTFVPFDYVKKSVEKVMTYYPQLCGRFEVVQDKGAISVQDIHKGMILYEAFHDEPLATYRVPEHDNDFRMESLPDTGTALLGPWSGLVEDPVFSIQYTKFSCGSVSMSVRTSHRLTDGRGLSTFYRNFADIYRQVRNNHGSLDGVGLKNPPYIYSYQYNSHNAKIKAINDHEQILINKQQQFALEEGPDTSNDFNNIVEINEETADASGTSDGITQKPHEIKFDEKYARTYLLEASKEVCHFIFYSIPLPPISGRYFYLSQEELEIIKKQGQGPTKDDWASTYVVLSALIWQSIHKARCEVGEKNNTYVHPTACFLSCVDLSQKTEFPQDYFPACNSTPFWDVTKEYLYNCPLWEVAQGIKKIIAETQPQAVMDRIDFAEKNKQEPTPAKLPIIDQNSCCYTSSHATFWPYDESWLDSECSFVSLPFSPRMMMSGLGFFVKPKNGKGLTVTLYLEDTLWDNYESHFYSYRQKE